MTSEQKVLVRFVRATDWLDPDNEDLRKARQEAADIIQELRGNRDIAAFYEKILG
jgi:hypothetical protein